MKIRGLKTNHMENPLGYRMDYLFFSWEVVETEGETDSWTRICIYEDKNCQTTVYDSGRMPNIGVPYFQVPFVPEYETRYYWQVEIEDDKGCYGISSPAWFETALAPGSWKAEWIGTGKEQEAMPRLFKQFTQSGKVSRARLYCYGVGLYEAYLNRQKIGDEYLTPGYHAYDLVNQYQTYDVTGLLCEGANDLSFLLGEGWYKGRFVFEGGYTDLYGKDKCVTAILKIRYEDGSERTICTDDTWSAEQTEILDNNIYDGERIDRNRQQQPMTVQKADMPTDRLTARLNVPLRKVAEYEVKEVIRTPSGDTVLDFGETITGWVEIRVTGEMDFVLQYGECMQKGEFYRENLRTAKAEFSFQGSAENEWIRPHFTYYGFRYVRVKGIQKIRKEDFRAYRLMSDLARSGYIETSDEEVNRLIENTYRSQQCNFIDMPLDCPQRDERMGWTGDIAIFARTGSFHMDTSAFLHHYMMNLSMEQKLLDGAVPFFVPRPKPEVHEGINPFLVTSGACTWGDAATIIPWELYLHYRDKEMLRQHYPAMCAWVDHINTRAAENDVPMLWQNDRQLGDWLALDNGNIENPMGATDTGLIASAYYYYSTVLCRNAAHVLGERKDEQKWEEQAQKIKTAFIGHYLSGEGELLSAPTQTAYAILLFMGLYEKEKREKLVQGMKQALAEYDYHLSTGFVGTGMLLQALSENGMVREAYTILLQKDYPGWLREVKLGATTVWERWNSLGDDGTISALGMNSLNHYAYGCVAGWMYEVMCGFHFDEEAEISIHPIPDKRFDWIKGSYQTVYGECRVAWEYSGESPVYRIKVPFQAQMEVVLPGKEKVTLKTGEYTFT